jgi:alpha-tubulin suppressor-like RCC1 family protein
MAACGALHTAIVTEQGELYVCGTGTSGQLGLGTTDDQIWGTRPYTHAQVLPKRVGGREMFGGAVVMVACGERHTAAVVQDGSVWTFGGGEHVEDDNEEEEEEFTWPHHPPGPTKGQLGTGDEQPRPTPTRLSTQMFGSVPAVMAACGAEHTIVLNADGEVFCFGEGEQGQLGLGDKKNKLEPTQLSPERFGGVKIVMVAAGAFHSVALTQEGTVFTWGSGIWGQLGHTPQKIAWSAAEACIEVPEKVDPKLFKNSKVALVAAGHFQTAAVTAQGELFAWGFSSMMMVAQAGGGCISSSPKKVGGSGAFGGSKVVTVSLGKLHSMAVTEKGELYTWGDNNSLQLGNGSCEFESTSEPRLVDAQHFDDSKIVAASAGHLISSALTEHGALYTWGWADFEGDSMSGEDPIATTGLGHVIVEHPPDNDHEENNSHKSRPTQIDPQLMDGARVGRCRLAPATRQRALAFAMITHDRLGAGCDSWAQTMAPEVVKCAVTFAEPWSWPEGPAGELEGLVRLLGGGAGYSTQMSPGEESTKSGGGRRRVQGKGKGASREAV